MKSIQKSQNKNSKFNKQNIFKSLQNHPPSQDSFPPLALSSFIIHPLSPLDHPLVISPLSPANYHHHHHPSRLLFL